MPWLEAWVGHLSGPFLLGNDMTMQVELGVAFSMLCPLKVRVLRPAKLHIAFRSSYKDRKLKLPRAGAQVLTSHPNRRLLKPRQASASVPCCPHPCMTPGSNQEHTSWKLEQTPAISFDLNPGGWAGPGTSSSAPWMLDYCHPVLFCCLVVYNAS